MLAATLFDAELAGGECRDQRSVARQDTKSAVATWRHDHVDLVLGEDHAFAGNDFDLQLSHDGSSDLSEALDFCRPSARYLSFLALLTLGDHVDAADIHECLLRQSVVPALKDFLEAADSFLTRDELTRRAGELLGGVERL